MPERGYQTGATMLNQLQADCLRRSFLVKKFQPIWLGKLFWIPVPDWRQLISFALHSMANSQEFKWKTQS